MEAYWLGVLLAIFSGVSHYTGLLIEKSIINKIPPDVKLMKNLVRTPLWLFALFLRFGVGTIFFMIAQVLIGPVLIPGLIASGLVILVLGSTKIIGEKLTTLEIIAIAMIIFAITLIGLSKLSIEISEINLLNLEFIIRMAIYTCALVFLAIVFQIFQKNYENIRGILFALISGLMFSLSNFWISPLMAVITHIFSGTFNLGELILFIVSSFMLVLTNIFAVTKLAEALHHGQASNLVPIQNVPQQITPAIVYFLIFFKIPPSIFSIIFFMIASILILISSFILGKRQAHIEEIK